MKKKADSAIARDDVERLRAEVSKAARRYGSSLQETERDDLFQASITRLLDYLDRHEEVARVARSFCWKTTYSAFVDRHRRRHRRSEEALETVAFAAVVDARSSPEVTARSSEIGRAISACLQRLNREYRLAVTQRLIGYSVADVAGNLGWEAKKADNCIYRGLKNLRQCLRSKGFQP